MLLQAITLFSYLRETSYGSVCKSCQRGLDTLLNLFRMGGMESTLSSRLSMISLPDAEGRELRFGSLWIRQPAVVVFLRHYG